jgi:hypothetical protein
VSLTTGLRTLTLQVTDPVSGDSVACFILLSSDSAGKNVVATGTVTPSQTSTGGAMTFTPTVNITTAGTYYAWAAVQINGTVEAIYAQSQLVVVPLYQPVSISGSIWLGSNSVYSGMGWTPIPNPEDIYQRITSGVTVTISGPGGTFSTVSDANGNFAINIPAGPNAAGVYNVTLSGAGYGSVQKVMMQASGWSYYAPFTSLTLVQGTNWFTFLMEWPGYN